MNREATSGFRDLSTFYFFYFVILGAFLPYWTMFLASRGMSAAEIGFLMGIMMVTKILSPFMWGRLADRSGKRLLVIRLGCTCMILCFLNIFWSNSVWAIALVMFGFSFFWNAVLPQFETLTLETLGENSHRYSRIRLWGSVGFIAAVLFTGEMLDVVSIIYLPEILVGSMVLLGFASLLVSNPDLTLAPVERGGLSKVVFSRPVFLLFILCFLMQFSHAPYYTFFSIYMEDLGYSKFNTGVLWSIGVVAEIGLFLVMPRLLSRTSVKAILVASLLLATVRWHLIAGFGDNIWVLVFAQCLHAATYASFHAAAISMVNKQFAGSLAGQGQALYSSVSFGLGGAFGAFAFGGLWDGLGGPASFNLAALVAFAGVCIGCYLPQAGHRDS